MKFGKSIVFCILVRILSGAADDALDLSPHRQAQLIRDIDKSQLAREARMPSYSVTEHYLLQNSRIKEPSEMTVAVVYTKDSGKTYQIVARSGPSIVQSTVLDKLLKEEAILSHGEARQNALITSGNYFMKLVGESLIEGHLCDIVELTPRTKNAHLLRGKIWIDAESHNFVRVEGQTASSPSFWTGRLEFVREYTQIGEFTFAHRTHSISQTLLLGRTDVTIDYSGYQIHQPAGK